MRASILALALILSGAGASVSADDLEARLEPVAAKGVAGSAEVRYTLSNTSNAAIFVLRWQTPVAGVEHDLFDVVAADGRDAPYIGKRVKRGAPTPDDYVELKAGASLTAVVDLAQYYDLRASGRYDAHVAVALTDVVRERAGKRSETVTGKSRALVSPSVTFVLAAAKATPSLLFAPPPSATRFIGCSAAREGELATALGSARVYSEDARQYFMRNAQGARYQTWFGAFNATRYGTVRDHFNTIDSALDTQEFDFDCTCTDNVFAYVFTAQPYRVYLCNLFWNAPNTGTDSRAGTIIHETSHFNIVAGTDDHAYGQADARDLALTNPALAIDNADSHEYFAENTPPLETCAAPTVTLTPSTTNGTAGSEITLTAGVTGTGPFTVTWDVDGDAVVDRTTRNVATVAQLPVAYPTATSVTVTATATDAGGCAGSATAALNVSAPDIVFTRGTPTQVCGDNDAVIEPGEQWRVPFTVRNDGGRALDGGYAQFAATGGTVAGGGAVDSFGYRMIDSTGAGCGFQAIPVSANVPALALTASDPNFPADDDGRTPLQAIGPQGTSLYGDPVGGLVMSTNGYLTADEGDDGGAFEHDCPDTFSPDTLLAAYHEDLAIRPGGGLYREYFATCPRSGEAGGGARGCTVFTWRNMARLVPGTAGTLEGTFSFQAIVYDGTHQIVYQYLDTPPEGGGDASIGLVDTPTGAISQYGCNQPNRVAAGRAVCFFNPSAQPPSAQAAPLQFDPPAFALNNLASGQTQNGQVTFSVPATAACDAPIAARYVGTVDKNAYSLRSVDLFADTRLGNGGACNVSSCAAVPANPPVPRDGLYSSLVRFGNGIAAYNIPVGGGNVVFGGQWFTGDRTRKPAWLTLQGDRKGAQADVSVFRFRQTGTLPFAAQGSEVGRAQVSYVSPTEIVLTWSIEGVAGGERLTWLYGAPRPSPDRTGAWLYGADNAQEIGWGVAMDDHILGGNPDKVLVNYIFDAAGNPVWTLGAGTGMDAGTSDQGQFETHCPTCPNLVDFFNTRQSAGTVTYQMTGLTGGTYATQLNLKPPLTGSWIRATQPWRMITQPVPQP